MKMEAVHYEDLKRQQEALMNKWATIRIMLKICEKLSENKAVARKEKARWIIRYDSF
ncbi:hypothetical protein SAMN05216244_1014 [Sediminibacillus halophilus]|uniref:Uncharacterized protein n=1 Tax=Sediminibacillus halophilus TaxID=482461 RepID=A0A1G9NHT7_9BACI|nr:hypothetical protein SAMN05216244_1014 [Sediminibacillus halophilus]